MTLTIKSFVAATLLLAITSATAGPKYVQEHGLKKQPAPTMTMEQRMQGMEQTMLKIRQTENDDERMRLMDEHIDQMNAGMKQMHAEEDAASVDRPLHKHKFPIQTMRQMSGQIEMQQKEIKRLHDHNKMK